MQLRYVLYMISAKLRPLKDSAWFCMNSRLPDINTFGIGCGVREAMRFGL